MALPSATISFPSTSIPTFHSRLKSSNGRILLLLGAGLSASSGLATFRGVGSDNHDPAKLATPQAFTENPKLVWRYYQDRREQALEAKPNKAHVAIAKLARVLGKERCLVLSMNVDGLCKRAGMEEEQLVELHGSLFDLKCSDEECDYVEKGNVDPNLISMTQSTTRNEPTSTILPKCPTCHNLLRPNIVWFTEPIPKRIISAADSFIQNSNSIDLCLIIGTTAQVWPAAGYVDTATEMGARVAMVNIDRGDLVPGSGEVGLTCRDWFFVGGAAETVPKILEP